ncbi:MAG: Gfo/Idh/MocA family oxidoreductase [Phycisphaerales bacterium]|nr:Gfo/Idh/MocA family oxidoreductase [Phycisphaerales bacterium]
MGDRLTYAMIGGGQGSFIGAVHRMAIALDGTATLAAGAFSSTPERSKASGAALGVAEDRAYGSFGELVEGERGRENPVDFVVIVTPNDAHYPAAKACLEAGLHVVCDKPFTVTSAQAAELRDLASAKRVMCAVTYNYSGYPMVRHAAELVRTGGIGAVRKVYAEYHQGWLATDLEKTGQKQAAWRTDPAKAGLGGSLGDIGTHAEQLVRFVTGLKVEQVCADLTTFVPDRRLNDDASVLLRLSDGAKGSLTCSQVCVGEANGLSLRVYGETGGIVWRQERPEELTITRLDGSKTMLSRGIEAVGPRGSMASRLPGGHPEGFIEAFANLYRGVGEAIAAKRAGRSATGLGSEVPGAEDGRLGVRFVEACLESARGDGWVAV